MKLDHAFAANAASHLLTGAGLAFAPRWLLSLFAVTLEPERLWGVRLLGVGLFGVGLIKWTVRAEHAEAFAWGLSMTNGVGCAVFLQATLQGTVNALGWTLVGLFALLSALFHAALLRGD